MKDKSKIRRFFLFLKVWFLVPTLLAIAFFYAAYKDLLAVFLAPVDQTTVEPEAEYTPSLLENLNSALDKAFTVSWKALLAILLGLLIIYLCVNTYKWLRTYYEIKADPDPEMAATAQPLELMAFIGVRCMTVAVPLLYWAIFIGLIWPRITALPIMAIFQQQMSQAAMMFVLVFVLTFIGVFIGVKLTRLMYTYTRKAWPFTD